METNQTFQIVRQWYDSIGRGDMDAVMDGLSEDIMFELPQDEHNRIIPYLGTKFGREQVAEAFRIRGETTEVREYEVRDLIAQGNQAVAVIYTKASHRRTGEGFEIEDSHHLRLNDDGKIIRWKVYFDPNTEIAAFAADLDDRLIEAVRGNRSDEVNRLVALGADVNARDAASGLTVLMLAAGRANAEMVRILAAAGADVTAVDRCAGASVLHKACQGGSVEVVRILLDEGAFVDAVAPTTGHTPLMDALWYKWPEVAGLLLERGAGLNLSTHYGFTLRQHFEYEFNVNLIGREQLTRAEEKLQERQRLDEEAIGSQQLMAAVTANDIEAVRRLIRSGCDLEARYPRVNGFNDGHTPLLVAARDGHSEIVAELLRAGADVNATEPVFGAVPLHKAVYNGRDDITRMLVATEGVDLDFQGATNGYTPLHDALWHGYDQCADILIRAGARLDLEGHDGKTPLDIALEVFGPEHEVVRMIEQRQSPGA